MPQDTLQARVLQQPSRLASGTTVPTSWTTIFTTPAKAKVEIVWASFVSQDANTYTLKVRLLDPSGTSYQIAQAELASTGEQWRLVDGEDLRIVLEPGWSIQLLGSGAGTISVHYYISGTILRTIN